MLEILIAMIRIVDYLIPGYSQRFRRDAACPARGCIRLPNVCSSRRTHWLSDLSRVIDRITARDRFALGFPPIEDRFALGVPSAEDRFALEFPVAADRFALGIPPNQG